MEVEPHINTIYYTDITDLRNEEFWIYTVATPRRYRNTPSGADELICVRRIKLLGEL